MDSYLANAVSPICALMSNADGWGVMINDGLCGNRWPYCPRDRIGTAYETAGLPTLGAHSAGMTYRIVREI